MWKKMLFYVKKCFILGEKFVFGKFFMVKIIDYFTLFMIICQKLNEFLMF